MHQEIVTTDGSAFHFRDFQLAELGTTSVRMRVTFAAPKHGTEMHSVTGSAFADKRWDAELRMFLPRDPAALQPAPAERAMGNMVVGVVEAAGAGASKFKLGERVFGYGPIRDLHQADEAQLYSADGLSDINAVSVDPAHVAFVAVRDGNIRIGDSVAVYGLGAIGLMAVQIARAGGARRVFAIDPIAIRRDFAKAHGADEVFDPTACDAALEIKRATAKKGVDVSIETSGNSRALHDAIRCIRQCGNIVHVPWGPKDCSHLHLDQEFHLNRPTLIASQAWSGWGCADRSYPLWDHERAYQAAIELLRSGLITGEGLIHPIVSFADAPGALLDVFKQPHKTIKLGVRLS